MTAKTTRQRKLTTTQQGLGWRHQQAVAALKRAHQDGAPCDWCGKPMWRDPTRNWDYDPAQVGSGKIQGDHGAMTRAEAVRRGIPIPPPDRLLHRTCNAQRGDGVNDHLAIVNRAATQTERLVMTWPWWTRETCCNTTRSIEFAGRENASAPTRFSHASKPTHPA